MRTIITTTLRLVANIIVMLFRLCLAAGSGGGVTGSASTNSSSGTSTNRIPSEIKIGDHWYQVRTDCTGVLKMKRDWGSSTETVQYTATKPNPVLHPNHYDIYDARGNKVGDFWNK